MLLSGTLDFLDRRVLHHELLQQREHSLGLCAHWRPREFEINRAAGGEDERGGPEDSIPLDRTFVLPAGRSSAGCFVATFIVSQ
jgi:hypothetical protein